MGSLTDTTEQPFRFPFTFMPLRAAIYIATTEVTQHKELHRAPPCALGKTKYFEKSHFQTC